MQFLYPSFLWALLALLIPIIIHLFYFRRFKTVYFTNVKFLKEIKEETSSRSKLKNLLVLLSRLLALALLVLAFAQPLIKKGDTVDNRSNLVGVFVDNSYSMNALSQDVPLIDKARDQARSIINAYSEEDKFQILTHDLTGRQQRLLSKEDAIEAIESIEPTAEVNDLQKAISRQAQVFDNNTFQYTSFIISDFQKNISNFELPADTSINYNLIPLQSVKEENVSIDSVWFAGPVPMINQSNDLLVRMTNYSENKVEDVALSILYDGQNRPLGSFDIGAKSSKIDTINLFIRNTGWQEAKLTITDYPVQYDDDYRIAFNVKQDVKVLSINESGSNTYLTAAFEGLDFFGIENQSKSRLQYSGFKNFDLIVFNDLTSVSSGLTSEIKQYAENGGNVLLFLPKNLNKESYNDLLNQLKVNNIQEPDPNTNSVNSINTKDFIFANVFEKTGPNLKLPTSNSRYKMTNFQNRGEQILLKYRDGRSYLSKYPLAAGQVYICNAPLNSKDNDLVKNAEIFVPMMYKMALAKGTEDRISYVIGQDQMVESDQVSIGNESIFKVKAESEFIPGITQTGNKTLLDMQDQIKLADVYDLTLEEELMGKLAFNYDRKESDLDYYNKSDLTDKYGVRAEIIADQGADGLTEYMKVRDKGMPLWRWCILGVLLFLLLETVLLRLWKN